MKISIHLSLVLALLLGGCNTLKETQVELASGNYEEAIRNSVEYLRKNRKKKKSYEHIQLLEQAFAKAVDRDYRNIDRLELDQSGAALEEIYETYKALHRRQEYIMPLLPLYLPPQRRDAHFEIVDYNRPLIDSRDRFSVHLYDHAAALLQTEEKLNARVAYENLNYLNQINPGYKNVRSLINEAHYKGTDFVLIKVVNASNTVLPQRLEDDLLDFQAHELNGISNWSVYHNSYVENIDYDYEMVLAIQGIYVGPERIHEKEVIREKRIKDGYHYELDENENVIKDAEGNDVKKDRFVTVRSVIADFTQSKSVAIEANIEYRTFQGRENLTAFPIESEYIFEHRFCTHRGDKRALTDHDHRLLDQTLVPFPSNEQMIYQSGEELKNRLKQVIADNRF